MNLRYIDWIWWVRGSLPIEPAQNAAGAFEKLEGFFQEQNTTYRIDGPVLTFTKKKQHPQDKMAVFDGGTLEVSEGKLHYNLMSKALLACFLAPLFFLSIGYAGVKIDAWRNPPEVVKAKAEAAKRRSVVKAEDVPMNKVDEFLGAPKPEKKKKDGEQMGRRNRKPSMTTAYVFMGIFSALWAAGRVLEQWLMHKRFRKRLMGLDSETMASADDAAAGAWKTA